MGRSANRGDRDRLRQAGLTHLLERDFVDLLLGYWAGGTFLLAQFEAGLVLFLFGHARLEIQRDAPVREKFPVENDVLPDVIEVYIVVHPFVGTFAQAVEHRCNSVFAIIGSTGYRVPLQRIVQGCFANLGIVVHRRQHDVGHDPAPLGRFAAGTVELAHRDLEGAGIVGRFGENVAQHRLQLDQRLHGSLAVGR